MAASDLDEPFLSAAMALSCRRGIDPLLAGNQPILICRDGLVSRRWERETERFSMCS